MTCRYSVSSCWPWRAIHFFAYRYNIFLSRFRLPNYLSTRSEEPYTYIYMYIHIIISEKFHAASMWREDPFAGRNLPIYAFFTARISRYQQREQQQVPVTCCATLTKKIPYTEWMLHLCVVSIFWLSDIILVIHICIR